VSCTPRQGKNNKTQKKRRCRQAGEKRKLNKFPSFGKIMNKFNFIKRRPSWRNQKTAKKKRKYFVQLNEPKPYENRGIPESGNSLRSCDGGRKVQ